jgi:hypothetical protein
MVTVTVTVMMMVMVKIVSVKIVSVKAKVVTVKAKIVSVLLSATIAHGFVKELPNYYEGCHNHYHYQPDSYPSPHFRSSERAVQMAGEEGLPFHPCHQYYICCCCCC